MKNGITGAGFKRISKLVNLQRLDNLKKNSLMSSTLTWAEIETAISEGIEVHYSGSNAEGFNTDEPSSDKMYNVTLEQARDLYSVNPEKLYINDEVAW